MSGSASPQFQPPSHDRPVIVYNDDHNTFEAVASAIAQTIPGVGFEQGMQLATTVHTKGHAIVWTGDPAAASSYTKQLTALGLTTAMTGEHRRRGLMAWYRSLRVPSWLFYSLYYFGALSLLVLVVTLGYGEARAVRRGLVIALVLSVALGIWEARRIRRRRSR
jgi:ATP-dependent Clp protease adaptor protein ClpS